MQSRIRIIHHLARAKNYQDRPEFHQLSDWWRHYTAGVCAIVGIGGAGKTAIAERFLRSVPEILPDHPSLAKDRTLRTPQHVFTFSFYNAPNADAFFAQLAAWLKDETFDPSIRAPSYEQTRQLLESLGSCLLVLDGLEKMQDDGTGGSLFGHITDGRLRDFILRVSEGYLPCVAVVVTTRFRLLDPLVHASFHYTQINVDQLLPRAAIALLRADGVSKGTDAQLEVIATDSGLHALTIDLTGGYIRHFCDADPSKVSLSAIPFVTDSNSVEDSLDPHFVALRLQETRFSHIIECYRGALAANDPLALAVLQCVCLFRLGVNTETLLSLLISKHASKQVGDGPSASVSHKDVYAKLLLLAEWRLIYSSEPSPSDPVSVGAKQSPHVSRQFSVHPSVRDSFLATIEHDVMRYDHDCIRTVLSSGLPNTLFISEEMFNVNRMTGRSDEVSDPRVLDLLEEITYHAFESGDIDKAIEIFKYRLGSFDNLGKRLGDYERGERVLRLLSGGDPSLAAAKIRAPVRSLGYVLNCWGLFLDYLGQLGYAGRCYETAMTLINSDQSYAAFDRMACCSNLADLDILKGHLSQALRTASDQLRFAEVASAVEQPMYGRWEIGPRLSYECDTGRSHSYAERAYVHALQGRIDESLKEFSMSLEWIQKADGDQGPLYSLSGIWHALVLARLGRDAEAEKIALENRKTLVQIGGSEHHELPKCDLILSSLARARGKFVVAAELLRAVDDWAVSHDAKELLCWLALEQGRLALAEARQQAGLGHPTDARRSVAGARAAAERGLHIARECGYGVHHIDLLLLSARLELIVGNARAAELKTRAALDEGYHPARDLGLPVLPAARDPECCYVWGEAEGRQILGEALLWRAAQRLGTDKCDPELTRLPVEAQDLIHEAREQLVASSLLRKGLHDPDGAETDSILDRLDEGVLCRRLLSGESGNADEGSQSGELPMVLGKRFRVALSFPGEYREYVAKVAGCLADILGRTCVFYDKYYEAELARPNLDTYLQRIYHDEAELVVVFLCRAYEHKEWCGVEWRAIRDLIKARRSASIMLSHFEGVDQAAVPGLFSIDGYISVGQRSADQIACLIVERLGPACG